MASYHGRGGIPVKGHKGFVARKNLEAVLAEISRYMERSKDGMIRAASNATQAFLRLAGSEVPIYTGNLHDSLVVGVYSADVLQSSFFLTPRATRKQHWRAVEFHSSQSMSEQSGWVTKSASGWGKDFAQGWFSERQQNLNFFNTRPRGGQRIANADVSAVFAATIPYAGALNKGRIFGSDEYEGDDQYKIKNQNHIGWFDALIERFYTMVGNSVAVALGGTFEQGSFQDVAGEAFFNEE